MNPTILIFLLSVGACNNNDNDSSASEFDCSQCGDPDGSGGDTGDIPNLLGSWSSKFADQVYWDSCSVPELNQTSESWINGAAMTVEGYAPDGLFAYFSNQEEEKFVGVVNGAGGIIFSGTHEHSAGLLTVSFGGQVFHDVWLDRDVIRGFAYMGLDTTDDGETDCDVRGNWDAIKSGS